MRSITENECLLWIKDQGIQTTQYVNAADFLRGMPFQNFAAVRFSLPKDSGQRVALARGLLFQLKPQSNILVRLRNWMVWPSSGHVPLVARLRQAMGCEKALEEQPGHLFDSTEIDDVISLLIVSLEFYWDCFIVDSNQRLLCFVSHDGHMVLMSRDQAYLEHVREMIETAKWGRRLD